MPRQARLEAQYLESDLEKSGPQQHRPQNWETGILEGAGESTDELPGRLSEGKGQD